jgi:hypothetical protein
MSLIIQKSLSLKEILPPLKSALLLHLLERILIILQNITSSILRKTLSAILVVVILI